MNSKHYTIIALMVAAASLIFGVTVLLLNITPTKPEPVLVGQIPEGTVHPEDWGKVYPLHYESWLKTAEQKPAGKSRYRKGWDTDQVIYDRLSEYPFSALLYKGWGFGIEYNEPRGHYYAVIDQIEIDPSRVSPGGVCLACKTPNHGRLTEEHGMEYLTKPFLEALNLMPERERQLGPSCIDCHNSSDMSLTTNKPHLKRGFELINKTEFTRQERRITACAQCHITYYVPRDRQKKVAADVNLPWTGAKWGGIAIEHIIADLLSDYSRLEWTQQVTGFDMPFIRHPEFELFSNQSAHFNAGATCADCHMPYSRSGSYKISDHDVTSPLKKDLRACVQCHTESSDWLKNQVFQIQDRTASLLLRSGYGTAVSAKLFELAHQQKAQGAVLDQNLYDLAKQSYMEAFLRVVFIGAENSTGFHNPPESMRVLGDAVAFAAKSEGLLRQMLTKAGIEVSIDVDLELAKYLNNRGKHQLNFKAEQEVKDPFGNQERFTSSKSLGI